jgi:hypothetical protein
VKRIFLLILIILIIPLCSCTAQNNDTYTVTFNAETFFVDTVNQEISFKGQLYKFVIQGNTITITYPDGSEYWRTQQDNTSFGGWSDDYNENSYISGDTLINVLSDRLPSNRPQKNYIPPIIALAIGIWSIISPSSSWYLSDGWKYKNAEPSEVALTLIRIAGLIAILAGIAFIVIPLY